ncbi:hypothetical protein, partial [Haloechinothrix sp. LS1_15]|uniref:hypothetical protein n=1 Tax=Haloechinothrix sp. LS1_15 TaxID=2652248 RepID=UPI00294B3F19
MRQALRAARVKEAARTPEPRPDAVEQIAPRIQEMLDALNDLPAIDLGILEPHNLDNDSDDQRFQPDEIGEHPSDPAGVPPAQGHLDDACAQGGHTRSDGSRSAQAWDSG